MGFWLALALSLAACDAGDCARLDYCECVEADACVPVTEDCFCPCTDAPPECREECDCVCGGGEFLECIAVDP